MENIMASYKTYATKVLKINAQQAEEIATDDKQFVIRGKYNVKAPRSKHIGKIMEIPQVELDSITHALKSNKRKFFELTVSVNGGLSPEKRAAMGGVLRGRKPTGNPKPMAQSRYLCKIDEETQQCKVMALL